jgi:hypothetical protein
MKGEGVFYRVGRGRGRDRGVYRIRWNVVFYYIVLHRIP